MPYTYATLLYARAVALAVLGRVEEAIEEEKLFLVAFEHKEMGNRRLHNNMAADILATKAEMLHGEIEYRQGNFAKAFAHLRTAVEMEDALPYDEPWGIMQPCRHALGALLLEQNLVDEAIEVYLADMMTISKNCSCQPVGSPTSNRNEVTKRHPYIWRGRSES